jgi:hypothetical protein
MTGDVGWYDWPQDDGPPVRAGHCTVCGTFAVECDCGHVVGFVGEIHECSNCGAAYEELSDRKGSFEGVRRLS